MDRRRREILTGIGVTGIITIAGCNSSNKDKTEQNTPESDTDTSSGDTKTVTSDPENPVTQGPPPSDQTTKLIPEDGDGGDLFGSSVVMSGDGSIALIGAYRDDDPNGRNQGSAYIFTDSGGTWNQQSKLNPRNSDGGGFGISVTMTTDGTRAIIGSLWEDEPNGYLAGAAYLFENSGGTWRQQSKLIPDDGGAEDTFGSSVAISDDGATAVIGAPFNEDPDGGSGGTAYIFDISEDSVSQNTKLIADSGDTDNEFGNSVAISSDGSTAIIGAVDDENTDRGTGSVYVFERSNESWSRQTALVPEENESFFRFGNSVAISNDGTTVVVGSNGDNGPGNAGYAGRAYIFEQDSGVWNQTGILTPTDWNDQDIFGESVEISADGTRAVIGAIFNQNENGNAVGSAYIFDSADGEWTQQRKLSAEDGDEGDRFGNSVALSSSGTTALVGAAWDEDPNGEDSEERGAGSAYAFE